jgi:hypothetical protein
VRLGLFFSFSSFPIQFAHFGSFSRAPFFRITPGQGCGKGISSCSSEVLASAVGRRCCSCCTVLIRSQGFDAKWCLTVLRQRSQPSRIECNKISSLSGHSLEEWQL